MRLTAPGRYFPAHPPAALLLCFLIFFVPSIWGETAVVLKRGPLPVQGIPILPRNAHAAFFGEYEYTGRMIEAYVTYTDIYRPESWILSDCTGYSIYGIPSGETGRAYMYRDQGGWTLLVRISPAGDDCPFLRELIRKLIYFQGISGGKKEFSFPAVLYVPE